MYKKLLVPIDGSAFSERAVRESIALARQLGAEITGFIAEPEAPLPAVGRPAPMIALETRQHDARVGRHAVDVLLGFEVQARSAGVGFRGCYTQSQRIPEAIAAAAQQHGCDVIVMATHDRGLLRELFFGSHTKRLMARTKIPLLVLH